MIFIIWNKINCETIKRIDLILVVSEMLFLLKIKAVVKHCVVIKAYN